MTISQSTIDTITSEQPAVELFMIPITRPVFLSGVVDGDHERGALQIQLTDINETVPPDEYSTVVLGDGRHAYFKYRDDNTIFIGYNDARLSDGDVIWIRDEIRPWPLLPDIENKLEEEYRGYVDQHTNIRPIARCGPPAVVRLTGSYVSVFFVSDSGTLANPITSHFWEFEGGTPSSSTAQGTVASPIQVNYSSPGCFRVKYTAFDSEGTQTTRRSYVLVLNPSFPGLRKFNIRSIKADLDNGGWEALVEVHEPCPRSELEELSQVVIASRQRWGDTYEQMPINYPYRHNVELVGFVDSETIVKPPGRSHVEFRVRGIGSFMKHATVWGKDVTSEGEGWGKIPDLTPEKAAWYFLRHRSTVPLVADVYFDTDHRLLDGVATREASLFDIIETQIGQASRAVLASNRQGALRYMSDLLLTPLNARPNPRCTLDESHWLDITFRERSHVEEVCQIDFIGFNSELEQFASLAPGRQHAYGRVQQITGVLVDGQAEANQFAGLFESKENRTYEIDVDLGVFWPPFDVVPQQMVQLDIPADFSVRDLALSANYQIRGIEHTYHDAGFISTSLNTVSEADPTDGLTNELPSQPELPELPPIPPPAPPPTPGDPVGGVYIATKDLGVYHTTDFQRERGFHDPTWTSVSNGIEGLSLIRAWLDPFQPDEIQFVMSGAREIYMRWHGSAWTKVTSQADWEAALGRTPAGYPRYPVSSIHHEGRFYAHCWYGVGQYISVLMSSDRCNNWTEIARFNAGGLARYGLGNMSLCALQGDSPYAPGDVLYLCTDTHPMHSISVWRSFDGGYSWSRGVTRGLSTYGGYVVVHPGNANIVAYFYFGWDVGISYDSAERYTDHTGWFPHASSHHYYHGLQLQMYHTHSQLARILQGNTIYRSDDFGGDWSNTIPLQHSAQLIGGLHVDHDQLFLGRASSPSSGDPWVIWVSDDDGAHMYPRAGANANIPDTGGGDSIPHNCGGICSGGMMPVWTEYE